METTLNFAWAVIALLVVLGFVGSAILPGWLRRRRSESARRQILLTDALDAELGPIVAPVVTRPFWGPWRIEIAAPLARPITGRPHPRRDAQGAGLGWDGSGCVPGPPLRSARFHPRGGQIPRRAGWKAVGEQSYGRLILAPCLPQCSRIAFANTAG